MAWDQTFDEEIADFDALSPAAWDGHATGLDADWDSETDADNDLNEAAGAAHDGAKGYELTFDDANVAYGTLNMDAVDQTTACIVFWFDPNSFTPEANKTIRVMQAESGAPQAVTVFDVRYTGSNWQCRAYCRTDTGHDFSAWTTLPGTEDDWHLVVMFWAASTGAGNDDGSQYTYVDASLLMSQTGVDNDTKDIDTVDFGMCYSDATSFGGSYYIDECYIDPIGAPMVNTLAKYEGAAYGLMVPIGTTTAVYGEFTDPSDETTIACECWIDPNTLTMATNDEFTIIQATSDVPKAWGYALLKYNGSDYQVAVVGLEDDDTPVSSSYYTLSDSYQKIRMVLEPPSGGDADDGRVILYIDDVLKEIVDTIDSDGLDIDTVRFGAVTGLDAGTYGILYMDTCRWHDEANLFETPGAATAIAAVTAPQVRERVVISMIASAIGAVTAPQVRERIVAVIASAVGATTAPIVATWKMLLARFHDYNFNAPQHFVISSNKAQMNARYRDYNFNAPKRESMATSKDVWLEGTPAVVVEGATPTVVVTFSWATTVSGTTTNEIYKDGKSTDVSSTYLTGSTSNSGNATICKQFQALVPGKYVLVINATVDGVLDVWKLGVEVEKQEALW